MKVLPLLTAVSSLLGILAGPAPIQHPFVTPGSGASKVLTPDFVKIVQNIVDGHEIPGLTVGVIRPNGETEYGAWGRKTEDGDAMTTDTLFDIGSCSKAFVAAAMGILIDDYAHGRNTTPLPVGLKKLDWDAKLKDILPGEWNIMDPWATEKANLIDIFSHVSGLPRHELSYKPTDSSASVVSNLQNLRPAFELREAFSYNNQMYMVGAHIVSTYTGSFTKFVEDRIFKPLNMTSSTYSPDGARASGKTTQTWTSFGRRIPWWFTEDQVDLNAGPGGVTSSAEDISKWIRALLGAGVDPVTNSTIIPPSAFKTITSAHVIIVGDTSQPDFGILGYGLGWDRTSYFGHDIITHGGALHGSSAFVLAALGDGAGVVVMANADGKHVATEAITYLVARKLFGLKGLVLPEDPRLAGEAPRSDSATSVPTPLPPHDYTGVYHNKGYGTVAFCNTSSTSHYCSQVLADFGAVGGVSAGGSRYQLFAEFRTVWSSHIRLTHAEDTRFGLDPTFLFPAGYGRNTTAFEISTGSDGDVGAVTFVARGGSVVGFGLGGTVGVPTMREKEGGSIEYTADAWFEKI